PQKGVVTYSYFITPDMSDRVRTYGQVIVPVATNTYPASGAQINLPIPTSGTGGSKTPADLTTSTITVAGVPAVQVINSLKVNVSLTHTFDFDLVLTLIAPDGRRIVLSSNNGLDGDNYSNTTFDDSAASSIRAGSVPFTGSFRPQDSLGQLIGINPN